MRILQQKKRALTLIFLALPLLAFLIFAGNGAWADAHSKPALGLEGRNDEHPLFLNESGANASEQEQAGKDEIANIIESKNASNGNQQATSPAKAKTNKQIQANERAAAKTASAPAAQKDEEAALTFEYEHKAADHEVFIESQQSKNDAALAKTYSPLVNVTLSKMGLSAKNIEIWAAKRAKTVLNQLHQLPWDRQDKAAQIASFIRKSNKKLPLETVWREAVAIVVYSRKYSVPADTVVGIAKAESTFYPGAKSKSGAVGVMQVLWRVHSSTLKAKSIAQTKEQMFDPEIGIEAGAFVFSGYVKAYGSVDKALHRYYGNFRGSKHYHKKVKKHAAMKH